MRTNFNLSLKKIRFLAILIIILTMIFNCFTLFNVNAKIDDDIAFNSAITNKRMIDVINNHIALQMQPYIDYRLSISQIKTLNDFDDNIYTLVELSPTGYIIYHNESGKFIEYGAKSPSPYSGLKQNLYYSGQKAYYKLEDGTFKGIIETQQTAPVSQKAELALHSQDMVSKLNKEKNYEILNYLSGTSNSLPAPTRAYEVYVPNYYFFVLLSSCGYVDGGYCGFIGAAMILGYNYYQYDNLLIDYPTHIEYTFSNWRVKTALTNTLINIGGGQIGTTAVEIAQTVNTFIAQRPYPPACNWHVFWQLSSTTVQAHINNGYAVEMFGSYPKVNGTGNAMHAIVCYGYKRFGFLNLGLAFRVHYGYSDYTDIWLESVLTGTIMVMERV